VRLWRSPSASCWLRKRGLDRSESRSNSSSTSGRSRSVKVLKGMRHDTVACDMTPTIPPLPDTLPADPLPLVAEWLADAAKSVRNSTAMTLATVATDGRPAARMVICRGFDARAGAFVFYTDRESDKGVELAASPWAALVFHWDVVERQIRAAGPVTDVADAESDRYWTSRPFEARAAAVASDQSRPLRSRAVLLERIAD